MKIGIIGSGRIGGTAARLLVGAGHVVAISNSRGPESLTELIEQLGPGAQAATVDDAARFGEMVLLAVPYSRPEALPSADAVRGTIVIDAMNPYGPDGTIQDLGDKTSSEQVAKRLPGARLVKAFNTIYFEHLASQGNGGPMERRRAIFLAGDDAEAKAAVALLIEEIGFAPVDTGSLRAGGRRQQPGSPVDNKDLTAEQAGEVLAGMGA
jgi:predicted dinucleotide-binding enzyme